jgi:hypothetical protein
MIPEFIGELRHCPTCNDMRITGCSACGCGSCYVCHHKFTCRPLDINPIEPIAIPIWSDAIAMLKKHQWSDTAYGSYGSTARRCPECGGQCPQDSLNLGGGRYEKGEGHKEDCKLKKLIED